MRKYWLASLALFFLLGCRGEPVPRDYQNSPPAMTHPPTSSSQTPTAQGMPGAAPEPTTGVEGKTLPHDPKVPQTPPADTTATTATTGTQPTTSQTTTAATGTKLAIKP